VDGIVLPILDQQWFKLKVSCKGQTVEPISGATESRTLKFTAYMQLFGNSMEGITGPGDGGSGLPTYSYVMWVEDGEGGWDISYNDTLYTTGLDDNGQSTLAVNSFVGFILPTSLVGSQQSAQFTIKLGTEGELKSAKIKTIGSDIEDSILAPPGLTLGSGLEYFGTMSISGSTVAVEKLPFVPEL